MSVLVFLAWPVRAEEHEWKDGKWIPVAAPAEGTPAGELALIRQHIADGKERKAIKAVKKYIKNHPDSDAIEEAMLLAGQAEMNRGQYYRAYEWLERQLSRYPGGPLCRRALAREYQIAEAYLAGRKRKVLKIFRVSGEDDALHILARIIEHAPGTAMAEKSLMRIADHYWSRQKWAEAADAYDGYLAIFGKSGRAEYATLQAARAMYASFNGVSFDETPLIDAEQRFLAYAEQFPAAARENNVAGILAGIAEKRAEKIFSTAAFYERTKRPASAVFCYKQVAEKYPKSLWAAQANEALGRLGEIKEINEPPKPQRPKVDKGDAEKSVELEQPAPTTQEGRAEK